MPAHAPPGRVFGRRNRPRRPPPAQVEADRRAVARFLTGRGPVPGATAAEALGWPLERWWAAIGGGDWFEITGRGWVLSDKGRAAVTQAGAAA